MLKKVFLYLTVWPFFHFGLPLGTTALCVVFSIPFLVLWARMEWSFAPWLVLFSAVYIGTVVYSLRTNWDFLE